MNRTTKLVHPYGNCSADPNKVHGIIVLSDSPMTCACHTHHHQITGYIEGVSPKTIKSLNDHREEINQSPAHDDCLSIAKMAERMIDKAQRDPYDNTKYRCNCGTCCEGLGCDMEDLCNSQGKIWPVKVQERDA